MNIEPYLEDLESRIDPEVEDLLLAEWQRFTEAGGPDGIFAPRRRKTSPTRMKWPEISVNQAFGDGDLMTVAQLKACSQLLEGGAGTLMCVRANYGSSILPSLFGVTPFLMDEKLNELPTSLPIDGGLAGIKARVARGVPNLRGGLGGKTLDMGMRFAEIGRRYPKIGRYVSVYHPDLQGPIDACEVLWGSNLFLDIMDEPGLVWDFMEVITETYIRFMREWTAIIPFTGDCAVHWGVLHKGHIALRDDSVMNFSPQMYDEMIRPFDQRLFKEFGGGLFHFCGRGDHYIASAAAMTGFNALAMSQPELNDMEVIFRNTVDRGIPLLLFPRRAAEAALARGRDLHGRVHGI